MHKPYQLTPRDNSGLFTLAFAYALGAILFRKLPLPAVVRFGLGAAFLSLAQFFLLLAGWGAFPYLLGFALTAWAIYRRPTSLQEPATKPLDAISRYLLFVLLAGYGIFYLVNALAAEIQPDAITYHLGLPAEYLRRGAFPHRMTFYDALPQGMEMLFTSAIAHGGYINAKLVHFAFFAATPPLLLLIARRLKQSDLSGYAAGTLYFLLPVAGISGSCAYNDAALVFFTLAAFYLLLSNDFPRYALAAGIAAGFCFAIKPTGLLVPALAIAYLLWQRKPAARFLAGAALMILPWIMRDVLITGNPLAPLFNTWFPNPYFSAATENALAQTLRTYGVFHWSTAPWQWAFGGDFQGVTGPLLFLLPLALLAWRRPAGRLLLAAGVLLLIPVVLNVGTRFWMSALPFLALALVITLPRPAVWACIILQAALCFPPLLRAPGGPNSWVLSQFPWRAALRLEPAPQYLRDNAGEAYETAQLVESATAPGDRIFTMVTVAAAYTTRDTLEFWHSNRARQLTEALHTAIAHHPIDRLRAEWPSGAFQSVRVVAASDLPGELRIFEVRFHSSGSQVYPNPDWFLKAGPNLYDAPPSLDGNRSTSWSTLTPQRTGMFLEVDLDRQQILDSIELLVERTNPFPGLLVEGRASGKAKWVRLADAFSSSETEQIDLRHEAARALKAAGFTHILATSGAAGLGPIGDDMLKRPSEWGLEKKASYGAVYLFRLL